MADVLFEGAVVDGVIRGDAIAARVRDEVRTQVARLREEGVELRLAVVRVGEDPASVVYVRHKVRDCAQVGIHSEQVLLPDDTTEAALLGEIDRLNHDASIDGILVQLPLPAHINADRVIEAVDPHKDVDGFHPLNLGLLLGRTALLQACTPAGVMMLLAASGVRPRGKHAVVVGRSVIVGRPVAQLLLRAHATVTICHRHTPDLAEHVARADILVVATGVPHLVRGAWIKPGAVVIDVGITRGDDGRLVGDVEFDAARERASLITPVPGGVGPMTRAMLLWNTVLAASFRRALHVDGVAQPLTPF